MIHTFIRILSQFPPAQVLPAGHVPLGRLLRLTPEDRPFPTPVKARRVGHGPNGPTYIFAGRKNCDLWRCLRLEPVTAIKIPSLIPYLQIFFAFNLDVMSQLGFPLSGCEKCQRDNPILLARSGVNCKPCCSYG